MGRYYWSRS